jgi:hypothetical protein
MPKNAAACFALMNSDSTAAEDVSSTDLLLCANVEGSWLRATCIRRSSMIRQVHQPYVTSIDEIAWGWG